MSALRVWTCMCRPFGALLCAVLVTACASGDRAPNHVLHVAVSIAPQSYLVHRIVGDSVPVDVLLPPGQSPHTYDVSPQQVARLSDAQALFLVGMPFDQRIADKFRDMFKNLRVIDTRTGISMRSMSEHEQDHDHEHEGAGEIYDPHFWLSPTNAGIMAHTIADSLSAIDPAHAAQYVRNLRTLEHDLDSVNTLVAGILAPVRGKRMHVFHPAFGYLTDAYGLEQVSVEVEGKEPSVRQLAAMIETAHQDTIRALFVQPQFPANAVRTIAERLNARVVVLDPLAEDYLSNLVLMAREIRANLE